MAVPSTTAAVAGIALEEWVSRAAEHGLHLDELQRLSDSVGLDLKILLDAMAHRVAEQYVSEAWTFAYCNRAMNGLFGLMREAQQCPDRAFAIFFAFSAGQRTHDREPRGLSAEGLYTRPMIAKIVPGSVARQDGPAAKTPSAVAAGPTAGLDAGSPPEIGRTAAVAAIR